MQALSEILYTNNLSKSYKESVRYTSVHSVSPCAYYISLLIYPPYFGRTSYYPVTVSLITPVPCLEYPVTMSLITLYHVLHYPVPCLTLLCYHVLHYSVTMSYITLLPCLPQPCLHQGMQNHKKRVDKLIIPRIHTPQNN